MFTLARYHHDHLHVEDVPLTRIASEFGTPCYVYSRQALIHAYDAYHTAFSGMPHQICYALKANSNLSILRLFADMGAGFDIVSGGELDRVIAAGGDVSKVVFSGVGKTEAEMAQAIAAGIHCFNVESTAELERLNQVASRLGQIAPVSLRVNPDVDAGTHPYISTGLKDNKFGIAYHEAFTAYQRAATLPHLRIVGIDCHIGSQLIDTSPVADALDRLLLLVDQLAAAGIQLEHIDMGGGVGIQYDDEITPDLAAYAAQIRTRLIGRSQTLILEPGRSLVGNAGLLLTTVQYLKAGETKHFAIVDGAMNDLIRPALYDGWHRVLATPQRKGALRNYDVVGPVCESGDFLAQGRQLCVEAGDHLAILSAGAYGMSMSSNYNTRPRAAEVLVDADSVKLIRRRESVASLLQDELACLS